MTKRCLLVLLTLGLFGASLSGAAQNSRNRVPTITLLYTTAESITSAAVVWNTNVASDSLLQYSTTNPIPDSAPTMYSPAQVTYHEFSLTGLMPGTLYYFKVTSCTKRGCTSATGRFDTYPSCPDVVPPVSGTWQKEVTPRVGGTPPADQEVRGIDAVSTNDVWAVGWTQVPDGPPYVKRTLIEHFDGTAWRIVPSPNVPNHYLNELHAVSAASSNDVWAVGFSHDDRFPSLTLIQHWDGAQWTIVPSPSPLDQLNALYGVAALSAMDAWAVGYTSGTQGEANIDTLIVHWDGVSWSRVPSPNVAGVANQLYGVAAISADDIWAVGSAGGAPMSLHWNGDAWTIVNVPSSSGLSSENLLGVSGAATNDVWAVGFGRGFFSNRAGATIHHWDGVHWTTKVCRAFSSSNPPDGYEGGGPDSYFTGVSAAASNDVWAVGVVGSGPYILHWDGLAWTQVTHPRAYPNTAILNSVTTLSGRSAWSAGREIQIDPSGLTTDERALIHRYVP